MRRVRCLNSALILTLLMLFVIAAAAIAHSTTDYVPWGIDEFEFFGLKKNELAKHFGDKLTFTKEFALARMCNNSNKCSSGPQFELSYSKDGQVATIQRLFVDGGGCQLRGPMLSNKRQALEFSINGLERLEYRDKKDAAKLASAKRMLSALNAAKKSSN